MNEVTLFGRVGELPAMHYTPSGKAVLNFSLATDESFGENKRTTWHDIVAWEKVAEIITEHVVKGQQLLIKGRLQRRTWESNDGQKHVKVEVVLERVEFGAKPRYANGSQERQEREEPVPPPQDIDPDEIPF